MSQPNCYLLSSHDDFSVVSMLPPDAAVLTQLRDPLDRFLSAYEFAVEVASRTLKRPKNYRKRVGRIATEDVWPWSYLVPFFAQDIQTKVAAAQAKVLPEGGVWAEKEDKGRRYFFNKALNETKDTLTDEDRALGVMPLLDPYDNELVISLKDFAMHPIAAELLHNGAAFQVLGITNYSHWGDANAFRGCLLRYEHLREQMVDVAKARVQRFTHVGTTDRLFESAASALVSMGLSVESPAYSGGDEDVAGRGGTRRKEGQGPGQGQGQGRGGGGGGGRTVSSEAAAQLQLLAKLIREARRRLQTAQKELVDAQRTQADPSLVSMLQSRVDTARNDLIEAQEKLAVVRDLLPANLGGGGAAQDIHLEENVGHAARRRLLEEVSSSSDQQGEDGTRQQQQLQGSETSAGAAGSAQVEATEEGAAGGLGDLEEMAEQRRRLASTVTLPTVDAFGNPLDPEYKRITRSNVGAEFMRCANRAQERSTSRRDQSLAAMATADGRHVSFSKAARTRIPQEVLDLIRSYNTMDTPLHQTGLAILDRRVSEQRAAGLYQDIPTELRARTDRGEERQRQRQQGARAQAKEDELR